MSFSEDSPVPCDRPLLKAAMLYVRRFQHERFLQNFHYTSRRILKACISEMGITAGFCTLKAQFIPSDFAFESARFDSVKRR